MTRILAVTPWGGACGIANYAEMLMEAALQADPTLVFETCPEALDPDWLLQKLAIASVAPELLPHVVWLNYHRGLHSRWTPDHVRHIQANYDIRVVVTFHDTYGESAPDPLTQQLHDLADAFIVHEPCEGLEKQILIRQGVPEWTTPTIHDTGVDSWTNDRPILGTCGFNFPWKNFDRLAELTAEAGWAYLVLSNNATEIDEARWLAANPHTRVVRGFQPTSAIVSALAGCDATAFPYECANSGTSGAIRLGIAARKPVIAWGPCRQFRDLQIGTDDPEPDPGIYWAYSWPDLARLLKVVPIQRLDPAIVGLAHRDSWTRQGARYAEIFRQVVGHD